MIKTLTEFENERERLGGFDANAAAILVLTTSIRMLTQHLHDQAK